MITDWKALCAELLSALENEGYAHWVRTPDEDELCLRARAALAEPEPEGPTDEKLILTYASAVATAVDGTSKPWPADLCERAQLAGLRAVLARWGSPNSTETRRSLGGAPQPIPVSERLPGPEDCDAAGRCWLCGKVEGDWRLINPEKSGVPQLKYCFSHWLPAYALPLSNNTSRSNLDG